MKTNQQFKNEALDALQGNWGKAILLTLLLFITIGIFSGPVSYTGAQMQTYMQEHASSMQSAYKMTAMLQDPAFLSMYQQVNGASSLLTLAWILLLLPLTLGYMNSLRKLLVAGDNNLVSNAVRIPFTQYWRKVWTLLLMEIMVGLWSLLLFIPGIIKSFSYAMTPYILVDNPELTASEAIHRSRMMMKGHKFDLFYLYLSFIGWFFLAIMTMGVGFLWLTPYIQTAEASFYEEIKRDYELNGGLD